MADKEHFLMPLDTFDLHSLLALQTDNLGIFKSNNDVIPIWNKRPARDTNDNDYYEFEIKCLNNTESEIDDNGCSKVTEITEHCYICDIAVPSGYMQNHCAGSKHRTCAKIISHSLHRANQHVTQTALANTDTKPVSISLKKEHFCDQCSILINSEDRNSHEITETHIKAARFDKQLQDFLALFVDKVVIENYYHNEDIRNDENEDLNGERKEKEDRRSDPPNLQESNADRNIKGVEEKIYSDKPYKAATVDYNEEFVLLKTMKDESVRIPTDNYHGFWRSANGIQCRVCRVMVVDTAAHKMEPRHIELVTASITDQHCIRPLNSILNHCILCNEIIGDTLSHICNNKQHYLLLKKYFTPSNEKEANTENTDGYYCSYCDLIVEKALKKRHKNSIDHRIKMWSTNIKMHHHLKATEVLGEILCKVCNIVLQNQQECLDEHLETFDHERNYEAVLASNKIRKFGDCLSSCQICNIRLVDKEELHHITGSKHIAKLQKWQESVLLDSKKEHALLKLETNFNDDDVSDESEEINGDDLTNMVFERTQPNYLMELSNDDQVKCKVCDMKIENNTYAINRHIETNNHKFNYDAILNYNKVATIESSDSKFYCEYCKVQVKEKSEIDHINDYLHSCERDFIKQLQSLNDKMSDDKDFNCNTKDSSNVNVDSKDTVNPDTVLNANQNAYYCDICNIDLENINNVKTHYESKTHKNNLDKTFTEKPKEKHYLMEVKNKIVQCKVCKVKVPNNVQNIQDHVEGRNHNITYNFLLNFNKIKKITDSFHCEICKETVAETMEVDHIDAPSHIRMRSIYQSKTVNSKKVVAVVKKDSKNEEKPKGNADKSNSTNNYYCGVCEVGVPNYPHNIKEHTSGLRHKANIDKILSNNNISMKKKNTYYCDLCKTYFSKASVVNHVQSEKHKLLQNECTQVNIAKCKKK